MITPVFRRFCIITSYVEGDHIYNAKPNINAKYVYYLEPANSYSSHVIVVETKQRASNSAEPDMNITVGHVPDALANVLY